MKDYEQPNKVQIPYELFVNLLRYFVLEDGRDTVYTDCKQGIQAKWDKLYNHYLYSKYKDKLLTDEEREQAKTEYLQAVGIIQQ